MAQLTVDQVQSRIAALVDQNESTADLSTDDYSLRLAYINMALNEWSEVNDWQVLYSEYNVLASTSTGNASIALPSNFRKLASFPIVSWSAGNTAEFPETRPQEAKRYLDTDRRVEVLGNYQDAYTLRVYGATLTSGASIKVPYYMAVSSLATTTDVAELPNPEYLVKRTVAYLWEAREDPRFPQMKAEADRILANMIEVENVFGEGSTNDRVRTVDETRSNFRIGRD